MPRYFTLVFCFLFALPALPAQDELPPSASPDEAYFEKKVERHDFDEKKWESLKEGIDYGSPKKKDKKKPDKKQKEAPEMPSEGLGLGPVFKILAIVVAVGLLVLLIVKMAGGENLFGPKNTKLKPSVSSAEIEKIEENLHEAELSDPIRRAIAARDYPMAVRLYYLAVLKELAIKNHIRWKRDKTNGAYLREMAGSPLFPTVQEATLVFERIWYGKVELSRQDFDEVEIKFKKAVATASALNHNSGS